MDSKHIEHLLEKYWACETSLEEELELKTFFNQEEIPDHLNQHAPLFKYLQKENEYPSLDESFDDELLKAISRKEGKQVKVSRWYEPYLKLAAVLILLIVASFAVTTYLNKQEMPVEVADTYENPEDAFEETKKALLLISKSIGKGRTHTQKITVIHEAQDKIKDSNNTSL